MVTMPLLTIAIPTFNRPEKVLQQAIAISRQISHKPIECLIIDNASDLDVAALIFNKLPCGREQFRIVRNPFNIGITSNICRCFELAHGEWIWLLGDDDPVMQGSLSRVIDDIRDQDVDVVHLKYGGTSMQPPMVERQVITGINELATHLASAWRFSSMLFISTSVFRRAKVTPYLGNAYHWCYSFAPHLVLLFCAMKESGKTIIFPENVVVQCKDVGLSWNQWRLIMGTATLGEIEGCEPIAMHSLSQIYSDWCGKAWWKAYPAIVLRGFDRPPSYWKSYLFRIASVSTGLMQLYAIVCALCLVPLMEIPWFRRVIRNIFGVRTDLKGLDRS
jgi:hypothetical protein